MNRPTLSLPAYLTSFVVFAAASFMSGVLTKNPEGALLFQFALFWVLNEIWYGMSAWLGVVPILVHWWKNRNGSGPDEREASRTGSRLIRGTSIGLLVFPHAIFLGLTVADTLAQGALQRWMHLELGAPLFLPSYLGCCTLFVFALAGRLHPFSVVAFLDDHLDPSLGDESIVQPSHVASSPSPVSENEPSCALSSAAPSQAFKQHERQIAEAMEADEELLAVTAPVPYALNRSTRIDLFVGIPFVLGAFWAAAMAVKLGGGTAHPLAFWGVLGMAAVFLFAGLLLVTSPLRWKKRLERTDYFVTSRRVFLAEGDTLRQFYWKDRPHVSLSPEHSEIGSVYLTPRTLLTATLGKLLGPGSVNARETDATGRMNGLLNIPQAERVHALIVSLIERETASVDK